MTYEVIVSDRAKETLGRHMQLPGKQNEDAARRVTAELLGAVRSLETMPEQYPFFAHTYIPSNKYHKMFVDKYYLLLYQIRDKKVFVDYVIDCREDYSWLLP